MNTYSQPPGNFDELIAPFPPAVREAAAALRARILAAMPEATENVSGGLKFGMALYSLGRSTNVACGIQPTPTHCKLYLHHVRPGDVVGLTLEGSGQNARHVKLASPQAVEHMAIGEAILRAGRGAGAV